MNRRTFIQRTIAATLGTLASFYVPAKPWEAKVTRTDRATKTIYVDLGYNIVYNQRRQHVRYVIT